jgi:hypothetical protein
MCRVEDGDGQRQPDELDVVADERLAVTTLRRLRQER